MQLCYDPYPDSIFFKQALDVYCGQDNFVEMGWRDKHTKGTLHAQLIALADDSQQQLRVGVEAKPGQGATCFAGLCCIVRSRSVDH